MLGSNQRPTDYIPTTAFAAAHAGFWSLDFLIAVPASGFVRASFVIAPLAAIAPYWRLDRAHTARQLAARLGKPRPTR